MYVAADLPVLKNLQMGAHFIPVLTRTRNLKDSLPRTLLAWTQLLPALIPHPGALAVVRHAQVQEKPRKY